MTTSDLLSADSHFAFGKNWLDYAQKIDEARINQAVADLQRLAGRERFDGLSFLDIGCGSGLHALAAIRMGAVRVVGVDIDADSVAASRGTLAKFAPDADARFEVVSVFDMRPETHGGFDVVYSWGVLHHTGDMYRALAVAASLVGGARSWWRCTRKRRFAACGDASNVGIRTPRPMPKSEACVCTYG